MSKVHTMFERIARIPLGRHVFSRFVSLRAPYFSTIRPLITELRPGSCTIVMKDRRAVRNHLKTVHAIAMCNLCELTMGMALHPGMPSHLRWIPREMRARYLKKARGTLTGRCEFDPGRLHTDDNDLLVTVSDSSGDTVMDAVITVLVSEVKSA